MALCMMATIYDGFIQLWNWWNAAEADLQTISKETRTSVKKGESVSTNNLEETTPLLPKTKVNAAFKKDIERGKI